MIARWSIALGALVSVACSSAPRTDGPDYQLASSSGAPGASGGGSDTDPPPASNEGDGNSGNVPTYDAGTPKPSADAGADAAAPEAGAKPTTVTVTIDGKAMQIDGTTLWSDVSKPGMYNLFVKVSGNGVASGSDFDISATATGKGCDNTANYITYRPSGDPQYMPASAKEPACGLTIDALPPAVGARFTGSFHGTLYAINVSTPSSKKIDVTFDVLRTQ
jgi:hypothetical protein